MLDKTKDEIATMIWNDDIIDKDYSDVREILTAFCAELEKLDPPNSESWAKFGENEHEICKKFRS